MTTCLPFQPPAPAKVQEVADGILWVRMPLPFALDHVNLWVLRDQSGWALVDTGMANESTRDLWERLLAGPLGGLPIHQVICTHFHPDHMGLAGWLTERFAVPLTTTFGEWCTGRMRWLDHGPDFRAHMVEHFRRAGYGPDFLQHVGDTGNTYRPRVSPPPLSFRRIGEGDRLTIGGRAWQVMACGGHSPEHACLWNPESGVLIAGDQILPRISPVVSVWAQEPEGDPLSLFLASLDRLAALPEDTLALPSHDQPFRTIRQRCGALHAHHRDRLERTREACRQPATALEVLRTLFRRPLDAHQTAFATAETLAHLNHLVALGAVGRRIDDTGVWLYQAT